MAMSSRPSSSSSSSSSSSTDRSTQAAGRKRPAVNTPNRSTNDSCFFQQRDPSTGCFAPRACRDCLQTEGCMINQFGHCVNMTVDGYNPWMDFHTGIFLNLSGPGFSNPRANSSQQQYHFPARTAVYCAAHDPVCEQCRRNAFVGELSQDTRFCVGARGCLCIAACELATWQSTVAGGVRCPVPLASAFPINPSSSYSASSSSSSITYSDLSSPVFKPGSLFPSLYVALITLVVSLLVILLQRQHTLRLFRMYHTRGVLAMSSANGQISIVARTAPLNLFGWRDHLQELIEKEQLLLAGCVDLSPVSHTIDFFVDSPTAPMEIDFPEGTAPATGDAFVNAMAPMLTPVGAGDTHPQQPSAPNFEDESQGIFVVGEYTIL